MEIIQFFYLLAILYAISYIIDNSNKKKEGFSQKTKQCSKNEINNAYKEYIFSSPQYVRR
jgi:hypothetical protein